MQWRPGDVLVKLPSSLVLLEGNALIISIDHGAMGNGKDVKSRSATVLLLIDGVLKRCNFRWVLMNYREINTSV